MTEAVIFLIKDVIIIDWGDRRFLHAGRRFQFMIVTVAGGVGIVSQDKIF